MNEFPSDASESSTEVLAESESGGGGVQDAAREVAGDAAERARDAAGQATDQARQVAGRAAERARAEVDRRSTEAGNRLGQTAGDLRTVANELREKGSETPARVADQVAERADRLADYLHESDSERILHDLEDYGRRQPWVVITAGLALGFVAARFLKASSGKRYESRRMSGTLQGSRATGNGGGSVSLSAPTAKGDAPDLATASAPRSGAGQPYYENEGSR
jgi:ElaB/YqjD/DUF883 family membrane-anchored ribosome-binding protein